MGTGASAFAKYDGRVYQQKNTQSLPKAAMHVNGRKVRVKVKVSPSNGAIASKLMSGILNAKKKESELFREYIPTEFTVQLKNVRAVGAPGLPPPKSD